MLLTYIGSINKPSFRDHGKLSGASSSRPIVRLPRRLIGLSIIAQSRRPNFSFVLSSLPPPLSPSLPSRGGQNVTCSGVWRARRYGFACRRNFLARACRDQRHALRAAAFNVGVNISSGVRVAPPRPLEPNWLSFQCHPPLLRRAPATRKWKLHTLHCYAADAKSRIASERRSDIRSKWNFRRFKNGNKGKRKRSAVFLHV